jgi:hypothetical protein
MGGNVFDGTRRYQKNEYEQLEQRVVEMLWDNLFDAKTLAFGEYIYPLDAYYSKESFGDMDIILNSKYLRVDYIETIVKVFKLGHGDWKKNGNLLSIKYNNFQIDLIVTPDEDYKTSIDYFAWNDLGNLVGRISHKFGIKYGHRGAYLVVRDGDMQLGEIEVSKSTRDIHEILGLNHDVWLDGFETMEDVYKWVINTPYFNPAIYDYDNRNHTSRTRDKKRVNYHGFIEWLKTIPEESIPKYQYDTYIERGGYNIREPFFTDIICKRFPHVKDEYDKLIESYIQEMLFRNKFNGNLCREVIELDGKDLGYFMKYAREQIDKSNMKNTIKGYKIDSVKLLIKDLFISFNKCVDWNPYNYHLVRDIGKIEGLIR